MLLLIIDGIWYRYQPILAIILYGCKYGKRSEIPKNSIIVAHSLTVTYSADTVFQKRLCEVPTRTVNTTKS